MKTPGDPQAQRQIPLGQVMIMNDVEGAELCQIPGVQGDSCPHAHPGNEAYHGQTMGILVYRHAVLPVVIIELAFVPPDGEYDDLISCGQQQVFHRPLRPQRVAVGNQQNFRHQAFPPVAFERRTVKISLTVRHSVAISRRNRNRLTASSSVSSRYLAAPVSQRFPKEASSINTMG